MRHAIPPSAEALYIQRPRAARSFWFPLQRPTAVCFGGYIVNLLAAAIPETLDAGVAFYGTPVAQELRKNLKGPLMIQLAELDQRVNESWREYEQDLKAAGAKLRDAHVSANEPRFPRRLHRRYVKEKAELAWQRTLEFSKHISRENWPNGVWANRAKGCGG